MNRYAISYRRLGDPAALATPPTDFGTHDAETPACAVRMVVGDDCGFRLSGSSGTRIGSVNEYLVTFYFDQRRFKQTELQPDDIARVRVRRIE